MSTTPNPLHTIDSLAARIKAKYPDYANLDNDQLVSKITQKHPEYNQALAPAEAARITGANQAGAFQTKPGGSIQNANIDPGGSTLGSTFREAALGASSGFTGAPEITGGGIVDASPLKAMGQAAISHKPSMAEMLDPTGGALTNVAGMAKNAYGSGKELVGAFGKPTESRGIVDSNQAGHAIGSLFGQGAQLGALKGSGEAVTDPLSLKRVGQEVMNEGPSKLRVLEDQHAQATAAQKHISFVAKNVHDDAQTAMSSVAEKIDSASPEGVFDKKDVSNRVVDAIGDTADPNQLPKSIRALLPGDGLDSMRKSTGPTVGGRHFDLSNPSDLQAYQKLKSQGAFTPEEVGRMEGTASGDAHTFNELQQIRSKVWKETKSLTGAPQAAGNAVYGELSKILREGARDKGLEPDWIDANARWKGYQDDFHRSPLAKTLEGDNAHEIMDPLANDKTRVQVAQILGKYKPFGMDMDTLGQEVGRFNFQNKADRIGQPSKWTVLGAMMSPKAAAIKTAAARSLRNPKVASSVMGKGIGAEPITPKQVYPTKAAAMAAMKDTPPSTPPSEVSPNRPPPSPTPQPAPDRRAPREPSTPDRRTDTEQRVALAGSPVESRIKQLRAQLRDPSLSDRDRVIMKSQLDYAIRYPEDFSEVDVSKRVQDMKVEKKLTKEEALANMKKRKAGLSSATD